MARGIQAMARRRMASARLLFDQVVEMAPGYAEGWNKRATVYYLEDNLPASMLDIERTLTLEPRHFGALSGMGLIFSEVEDVEGALEAFEAVLEIHPHSPTARASAEELRRKIRDEAL
jgi:tetratricopeptide (TPR) repeat protein